MAFIEASLEELPVSAKLGRSCLATKISAPGPSSFGWFRHITLAFFLLLSRLTGGHASDGSLAGVPLSPLPFHGPAMAARGPSFALPFSPCSSCSTAPRREEQ